MKDPKRYFVKPILEWLFNGDEPGEVTEPVQEVPDGITESTLDACTEAAALEIALDAGPDGMSFEEAAALIQGSKQKE